MIWIQEMVHATIHGAIVIHLFWRNICIVGSVIMSTVVLYYRGIIGTKGIYGHHWHSGLELDWQLHHVLFSFSRSINTGVLEIFGYASFARSIAITGHMSMMAVHAGPWCFFPFSGGDGPPAFFAGIVGSTLITALCHVLSIMMGNSSFLIAVAKPWMNQHPKQRKK